MPNIIPVYEILRLLPMLKLPIQNYKPIGLRGKMDV